MGIGVALLGTALLSKQQSDKAIKADERATRLRQRQQDLRAARERRKQIREARAATAAVRSQSVAQGTRQSSGTTSQVSSIASEKASNLNFIDQNVQITSQIGDQNVKASKARGRAQFITNLGPAAVSLFPADE